ncbi:DUF4166 domain-containing protein [Lacisediminihabitans sp.]|uniref:DUF4166 domain-containing protein n=1 Tax=Lacisediminihabitans sp. TaxID=2787631 RepID=UPI00374D5ACC
MSAAPGDGSPYRAVVGGALDGLHPRLRAYFGAIPVGSLGRGEGVFDVVGTPRRWLWPALWVLGRQGVLFAVWQRDVPFTVINRPIVDAAGRTAVAARGELRRRVGPAAGQRDDRRAAGR